MIISEYVIKRDLKFKQNRYGISVIFGLGLDKNIIAYITEFQNLIPKKLAHCFNWYDLDRIHATLVRCTSKNDKISYNKFWDHSFERELNRISKFKLISNAVKLGADGAIRLYLESDKLPLPIHKSVIEEFEIIIDRNLRLIESPWFAIANMKPDLALIEFVNSKYNELCSSFPKNQIEINVNCLKAVYFMDTGFRRYKILNEYKLN